MKENKKKWISGAVILAFWLGIWWLAALAVGRELLLPTPVAVFRRLLVLVRTADFWKTILASILRVTFGILLAIFTGILLALLTSRFSLCRRLFAPFITVIRATPVASFIILALLWLGASALPVFIASLIVLPIVWAAVSDGIAALDPRLSEVCRIYRFPLAKKLRSFYLPSVMPYFVSACRTSIGMAWKAGVAAEVLAVSPLSIGKQLYHAKIYLETEDLFAWTTVVILLSLLVEFVITHLLKRTGYSYFRRKNNAES